MIVKAASAHLLDSLYGSLSILSLYPSFHGASHLLSAAYALSRYFHVTFFHIIFDYSIIGVEIEWDGTFLRFSCALSRGGKKKMN